MPQVFDVSKKESEFVSFWDGELDGITYGCLASFPYWGARLRIYSYNENLKIPAGVELADAREICPDENLLNRYIADGQVEPAKFANLFRYLLLGKINSCWVDADILCLKPPDFSSDQFVFGKQFPNQDHRWFINNAVLKLPSDSGILTQLVKQARAVIDLDQPWGVIGPELVTRLFKQAGLFELARPVADFYPLSPDKFWMPLLPEETKAVEAALSASKLLHLWNNQFKRSGYDKQAAPPRGSFLHDTFSRIGGLAGFSRTYDVDELKSVINEYLPKEQAWSNDYARSQIREMASEIATLQKTNGLLIELFSKKPNTKELHPITTKIWKWLDGFTVVFGIDGVIWKDNLRAGVWYHLANYSNAVVIVWDQGGWLDFGEYDDNIGMLKCRNNVGYVFDAVAMQSLAPEVYKEILEDWFFRKTNKALNLNNPKTFSEKIQWLKLYDSTPIKARLADKYLVRDYVREKIGEEYLITLLGAWDRFEEIDFGLLPDKFVLKANHGSAYNLIVSDKSLLNIEEAGKNIKQWLVENYAFKNGLELHYKDIAPKIIAEEYIENNNDEIYDYKVFCFDGQAKYIQYLIGRSLDLRMAFYDREWNLMPFISNYARIEQEIGKPNNLEQMLTLAEKLAQGFAYVRVDFYRLNNGELKFGELTFTPASGIFQWDPPEYDEILGNMLNLPI